MATSISAHTNDGCVGRCDAKCHDATSDPSTCKCICGGMNHGVGQQVAFQNTQEFAQEWQERYNEVKPAVVRYDVFDPPPRQLKLPL